MKFRCEREILADAVAAAGRGATSSTGTSPVLSGVRFDVRGETLTVTGTDLELSVRATVPVGVEAEGAAVVPARLVADIVKALPAGSVEVALGTDQMTISAQRSEFSVRPLALDDFPALGEPSIEPYVLPQMKWRMLCVRWFVQPATKTLARCSPACFSPPRTTR